MCAGYLPLRPPGPVDIRQICREIGGAPCIGDTRGCEMAQDAAEVYTNEVAERVRISKSNPLDRQATTASDKMPVGDVSSHHNWLEYGDAVRDQVVDPYHPYT